MKHAKESNKQQVFDNNWARNQPNTVVSDLKPGDRVRKNIWFNDKYSKGSANLVPYVSYSS